MRLSIPRLVVMSRFLCLLVNRSCGGVMSFEYHQGVGRERLVLTFEIACRKDEQIYLVERHVPSA